MWICHGFLLYISNSINESKYDLLTNKQFILASYKGEANGILQHCFASNFQTYPAVIGRAPESLFTLSVLRKYGIVDRFWQDTCNQNKSDQVIVLYKATLANYDDCTDIPNNWTSISRTKTSNSSMNWLLVWWSYQFITELYRNIHTRIFQFFWRSKSLPMNYTKVKAPSM